MSNRSSRVTSSQTPTGDEPIAPADRSGSAAVGTSADFAVSAATWPRKLWNQIRYRKPVWEFSFNGQAVHRCLPSTDTLPCCRSLSSYVRMPTPIRPSNLAVVPEMAVPTELRILPLASSIRKCAPLSRMPTIPGIRPWTPRFPCRRNRKPKSPCRNLPSTASPDASISLLVPSRRRKSLRLEQGR